MNKFPYSASTRDTVSDDLAPKATGFRVEFDDAFLEYVKKCQEFLASNEIKTASVEVYHINIREHVHAEFVRSDGEKWWPDDLSYFIHSKGVECFDRSWGSEGTNAMFAEFGNDDLEAAKRQGVWQVMSDDVDEDE